MHCNASVFMEWNRDCFGVEVWVVIDMAYRVSEDEGTGCSDMAWVESNV